MARPTTSAHTSRRAPPRPAKGSDARPAGARPGSPRVVLLLGDDEHGAESAARARADELVPPPDQALGLELINGRADTVDDALRSIRSTLEAVGTVGFLGGRKAVWWRGVNFVNHPVIGRNAAVQAALQRLAATVAGDMPAGHVLIVTAPRLDARTSFFKACEAHGEIQHFEVGEKPWQRDRAALALAERAFRQAGLRPEPGVLDRFVRRVGSDTRHLAQETDKLAAYLGDSRTVTASDVQAVTSPWREMVDWDLQDAVGARDLAQALAAARQLLFQRLEPIRLIAGLETQFRHLLLFREALDANWIRVQTGYRPAVILADDLPAPAADQFRQALTSEKGTAMNPYVAAKLAAQALGFTRAELDERRAWLLEARQAMVSSALPKPLLLELLLLKLCQGGRPPDRR